MNWLQKTSYTNPLDLIQGILDNYIDGSAPSMTNPAGGVAYQEFQKIGPVPEVCEMINNAAASDPTSLSKMRVLAKASGCNFNPQNPDQNVDPNQNFVDPMLGQQEVPEEVPSLEIE